MSIKIGHASIDENGKVSGGQAGDQNKKEVCTRTWYSKPWQYYLECTDDTITNIAATYMEKICANDNVGYDQSQRLTLYNQLKSHKDVSILTPCECDCSSLVACCYIMAGLNINPSCTTRNIRSALLTTGKFKAYSDSDHLTSDKYAKRGGIYLKEGSHIVMALENGSANTGTVNQVLNTTATTKGIDVSGYNVVTDYQAVKNDGVQFAILKIIRKDLGLDKLFETHLNGFNKVGIPVIAVYNYSYCTTVSKSKSDAQAVVKYLKQYNIDTSTTVYMDVEDKCQQGLGSLLIDMINAYQEVIENSGYKFGLYTGMSFYNSYIKPYKSSLKCNTEWIARYYNGYNTMSFSSNPNETYKPNIDIEIEGWQYTSSGKVAGITGNVDLNILYNNVKESTVTPPPSISTSETLTEFLGKINTTSNNLNIRSEPSSNATKVGSYKKGELVQIISKTSTGWYRTDKGYISGDYVVAAIGKVSNCTKLNMRKEPEVKTNNIISILGVNTELYLLQVVDGWYKVKTKEGIVGYVSQKYITVL